MRKYFTIYHRQTGQVVSCFQTKGIGIWSFSKTDPPRLYKTVGVAKASITNGMFYSEDDKLFVAGLEVVEIIPNFEIGETKFQKLFEINKI